MSAHHQPGLFGPGVARFSPCGRYRYTLERTWDAVQCPVDRLIFVMLNPSTADADQDDPTIRRCIGFARAWGYSGLVVLNLFALRSTNPALLKHADDPVGPQNDQVLAEYFASEARIVVAWGAHGQVNERSKAVRLLLNQHHRFNTWCLGRTAAGEPKHPLYLAADTKPELYTMTWGNIARAYRREPLVDARLDWGQPEGRQ
jgi:hypothetical protein